MKTKKVLKFMTAVCCLVFAFCLMLQTDADAAGTVTVTPDKTSVGIGETVNVTVQTSVPEDPATIPEVSVTYNSDVLTFAGCNVEFGGGGGLVTFVGQSATITFTATQAGAVSVGAEAIIDDDGANPATANAMITVGASAGGELSSNATLYVLEMNPGQLVPAFSSDVTEYQIVIGNDVTDITVSGAVSDPGAQITAASGFKNLKEGTNQAVITVTAADGSMLTYHFTIVRGEAEATEDAESEAAEEETEEESTQIGEGLNVTLDGNAYTVQSVIPEEVLPDGCTKTTSTFNGKPVEAVLFEKGGLTLLYALPAGSDEGNFFVYNETSGNLQLFVQIYNIENRYIVPIEAQDNPPAQFKESKMPWGEMTLPAFSLEDTSIDKAKDFYLLYAVSNEGERGFYLYDTVEGTYQRFLNYTGAKMAPVTGSEDGLGKKAIIAIVVLALLLIGAVMLIVNMIVKNKEQQEDAVYEKRKPQKKEADRKTTAKRPQPKLEPKPVERKPEPKPAMKKAIVPQPVEEEEEKTEDIDIFADEAVAEQPKKPAARKPESKPAPVQQAEVQTPQPQTSQPQTSQPQTPPQRPRQMFHTDHVVTMQPRQVEGAVSITGNIPVKVVPTPKTEVRRPSVPIFTLEKPSELDDDFEFEFINIDND